ncbi:DUF5819 family protein [Yinghuangia soli]|uniref:DUF5819 family protein n=1 Tax=Yinghuangia soli TaxID=2908204 RepID=A0AA41PWF2_9ACTN|nr:DUF5819 family protein [Yinghuangia soli]MCF2526431.1 DUF5819 family protein [Yinghuangia soli]
MPAQDSPDIGVEPETGSGSAGGPAAVPGPAPAPGSAPAPGTAPMPPAPVAAIDPEDPAARSTRVQMAAAVVAMLMLVGVGFHLLFVTLHVAPPNQASRKYADATDSWIYPLFEQNWRLFAPDPLNINVRVNARVQYKAADGTRTESAWFDLTGDDVDHIRGNPFPSKADQNLLRRAWDFYNSHHADDGTRTGGHALLSEQYLRRIVIGRLQDAGRADGIVAVQVRAVSTQIAPPGQGPIEPTVRELVWWEASPDDFR